MLKKCLSILLVSVMIFSVFTVIPFSATAEEIEKPFAGLSNDDVTVSGTNSLGNMLAEKYEESAAEAENTGSGIYGVEVEGKTARVDVRALVDAQLVVSIFDEEGKTMYGSSMTDVTPDDNIVELTLEVGTIPQFFLIRAFLLDKLTNQPLCKQFENDYYTQKMQEFFSKTTEEFEEDKVLNLDDNEENNFLVYNEDTIRIENEDDSTNVVAKADDKNKEYIIENIDEHIASLKDGDIFSYDTGDGDLLIIKISSIKISGTTAIIQGAEMELQEAFDFIRIDSSSYTDKSKYTPSDLGESVEYLGETDAESDIASTGSDLDEASTGLALMDLDVEHSHELNFKFGEEKEVEKYYNSDATGYTEFKKQIYGEIGLKLAVNLKVFYDERLFGGRDVELSVTVAYKASLSLKAKLNLSKANSLGLGGLFFEPVPGVSISLTPSIKISGKLKAAFAVTYSGQIGFQHKNGNNEDLGKSPKADFTVDFEGELFIGLSLEPQISVLGDVAKAKAEAIAGLRIKAKTHHSTADAFDPEPSEKHFCSACIEGDVSLVLELKLELALFNNRDLSWDAELVNAEWKLCDFYFSVDHMEFGLNKCPYREYKCIVTLLDKSRQPLANTTVNDTAVDENGAVKLYLKAGSHQLQIKKGGKSVTRTLRVTGAEKSVYVIDFDRPDNAVGSRTNGGTVVNQYRKVKQSGQCGDDVYFTLYDDGYMEITGTGDMNSFVLNHYDAIVLSPWYNNRSMIRKIRIDNSVTNIGEAAFSGCTSLTSITIPDSVMNIGYRAFYNCTELTSIDIPDSVTSIGIRAFEDCTELTSVTIPDSVTSIGHYAFFGCTGLTSVTIPDSVTSIGSSAFKDCTGLTSVSIPNSVTSIGDYAFSRCYGLKSVNIPDSVTSIDAGVFQDCISLTNIDIPDSVTSIGYHAFEDCTKLSSIDIPDSVTSIGNMAFFGCRSLTSIGIPDSATDIASGAFNKTAWYDNQPDGIVYAGKVAYTMKGDCPSDVIIKKGTVAITNDAFKDCRGMTSITIPSSVTSISYDAFLNCIGLMRVHISDVSAWCSINFSRSTSNPLCNAHNLYMNGDLINELVIPDSVTNIGRYTFYGCRSLTSVTIPDSVTSISYEAFRGCTGLTSVDIPDSVTSIGSDAFRGCTGLTSVDIPDSVASIGSDAFRGCTKLTSATLSHYAANNFKSIFSDNYKNIEKIVLNDSVTSIGTSAFYGCEALRSITIGNSVTSIGYEAFRGCTGLTSVDIPDSVKSIGRNAFRNCTELTSIDIPDSVISISVYAFSDTAWYDNQPDGLVYAGKVAYKMKGDCPTIVVIKSSTLGIAGGAFENCTGLTSIDIPDSVTSIGDYAFYGCSNLTSIDIPDSVASIGYAAFRGCTRMISIDIPDSVTSIGDFAFNDCNSMTDVYYSGSKEAWAKITIGSKNSPLNKATIHYNSSGGTAVTGITVPEDEVETEATAVVAGDNVSETKQTLDIVTTGADEVSASKDLDGFSRIHLIPDTDAVLIILAGTEDSAVFNAESLLYIAQGTVDENGEISFDVQQGFGDISWVAYIIGECDHSSATWKETKQPTEEGEGMKALVCDHCGEVLDTQTIEALPKKFYLGDADGNEEIDINDATFILRYLAKIDTPFTKEELMRGDVDGSGDLELPDVTAIQYYLANMKIPYHIGELV